MTDRTPNTSFSGHETFVLRYAWPYKAARAATKNPTIFNDDNAMVDLGVGKNMVRSIRHWALAAKIIDETPGTRGGQVRITPFGKLIFGNKGRDPYLEDINTLWLLHWNIVTNQRKATTWAWAFNLYPAPEFTRETLANFIINEANKRATKPPNEHSLKRDIDCFIRTYIPARTSKGSLLEDNLDCPLVELGILQHDQDTGLLHFRRHGQPTLSDTVFAYCLAEYWNQVAPDRDTLAFTEIAYGFGSPGNAFKIDENSLADRLDRLAHITAGALRYDETAGLKQLYRKSKANSSALDYLDDHYRTNTQELVEV